MTTAERLAIYRTTDRRNAERIANGFLKYQLVSNGTRVVVLIDGNGFRVSAQEYAPNFPMQREVRDDGWRETSSRYCPTFEGATRVFERMVRDEQRFAEMR